jgi:hypothetical protein
VSRLLIVHDLLLNWRTETFPSLDAHARIAPSSYGAQAIELTMNPTKDQRNPTWETWACVPLALCPACSLIFSHSAGCPCPALPAPYPTPPPTDAGSFSFHT